MQAQLRELGDDEECQKWLFCNRRRYQEPSMFQEETLIAIKAPHGTTLEVPDPDEGVDYPQRRYRIILRSTMGLLDVYLVSEFEEKFENAPVAEIPPNNPLPSYAEQQTAVTPSKESNREEMLQPGPDTDRHTMDPNTSQDSAGDIMKIVPLDVDTEADYWLLSDTDVSITDMWKSDSGVESGAVDALNTDDFLLTDLSTPRAETPPHVTTGIPSTTNSNPREEFQALHVVTFQSVSCQTVARNH